MLNDELPTWLAMLDRVVTRATANAVSSTTAVQSVVEEIIQGLPRYADIYLSVRANVR